MKTYKKVYDFREDIQHIEFLRVWVFSNRFHETNGQPVDGFIPGSTDWFMKIDEGKIPLYKIEGVISDVYMSGHNDWPEFEIDSNGVKTNWTRCGDDTEYIVGREIIVRYTKQKLINGHVDIYKTVLEIEISNE